MPDSIRRCSNPTTVRACVNCQKRKSRCMRGSAANDPCSYCAKTGKTCSFEKPPDRTPLTRKNLDAAELKCKQLQGLIKSLNPELDVNSAFEETQVQQDSVGHEDDGGGGSLHSPPGDSDEVTPHSYEWHEGSLSPEFKSSTHENDGMAMLPTHDSGYLDTRIPRNIDDKELPLKAPVPSPVDYPTTYSAIIAQAKLAKIADAVYHEFLLAKTAGTKVEYRVAETMDRDLNCWHQALPAYFTQTDCPSWFRAPRAVVLWKEQNLRILLWRGSQQHHSYLPTKVNAEKKCLNVAMQSVHDIATFCMANEISLHQGIVWYATYFLFQATLVLEANYLTKATSTDQTDRLAWQHSVSKSRACLKTLAQKSRSAKRCLDMLDRIHSQFEFLPQLDLGLDQAYFQPVVPEMVDEAEARTTASHFVAPSQNFADLPSENDFALYSESQPAFDDDAADPSLRMLLNESSIDFMESMPLDLLLGDWTS
ncbi:hypothetical protein COL516b_000295 [Colletotrichum fioriniae]|nr:uncharacterized protein COL516b_000295 [Colletotrichum fioriniae]KAJ0313359.1 hypothetical protein COL516b_000295 [Colletotrichum fioriniae]